MSEEPTVELLEQLATYAGTRGIKKPYVVLTERGIERLPADTDIESLRNWLKEKVTT